MHRFETQGSEKYMTLKPGSLKVINNDTIQ